MGGSDNRVYIDGTGSLVFYGDEKLEGLGSWLQKRFLGWTSPVNWRALLL